MNSTSSEVELDLVVASRSDAADSVTVLELSDPAGAALPPWEPGAHVDLVLSDDLTRQYSLCGDPADAARWTVAVLREPVGRGGSQYVHDKLGEGDRVRVRGPRNHFRLEPAQRYQFIAGGIGITPIRTMVAAAAAAGAEWALTYGGRSRASMAFLDELTAAYGSRVSVHPQDECGLLDLDALLGGAQQGTRVYCCGPGSLLDAVEQRCASWPAGSLHVERFSPRNAGGPVLRDPFDVELTLSGRTLTVPPQRSILDVVRESGVQVLSSCEEGTCGTCETPVLDGVVDHRDSLLTADEQAANDTMMICVSRAACPRLALEL